MFNTATHKVLADGTQVPAEDPRTDHVAVLFEDGTLIGAHTIKSETLAEAEGREEDEDDEDDEDDNSTLDQRELLQFIAEDFDLLGRSWQLASDTDYERYVIRRDLYPAHDKNLFPNLDLSDWYWTRTECAWSKDAAGVASSAFVVSLYNGHVYDGHRDGGGFGLAVSRPGQ